LNKLKSPWTVFLRKRNDENGLYVKSKWVN
jgi:hypothetical protein